MTTPCRHRFWIVPFTGQPESLGTCKCGEWRMFSNVLPYDPGFRFGGPSERAIATSQSIHAAERRRFYEGEEP